MPSLPTPFIDEARHQRRSPPMTTPPTTDTWGEQERSAFLAELAEIVAEAGE